MKKIGFLFATVIMLVLFAVSASAETEGYYTYEIENGEATITEVEPIISGDITLPSVLGGYSVTKIGYKAFEYRSGLTSITIPDSVTSISDDAFENCKSLINITIGDGVESIGDGAFNYCTSLTNITIGDAVTSIGEWAFGDCTSLVSITIPNSVISISETAFNGCTSLTRITVDKNNAAYSSDENGILFDKNKTLLVRYPLGRVDTLYTVPDSVEIIGIEAFYDCINLTSITIPESVTEICSFAFWNCTSLTSITIPESVTEIGYNTFKNCTSLVNITIPYGVADICCFGGCTKLTSITIPDSVEIIGDEAFYDCTNLSSITIPDSVTEICFFAFWRCTSLTDVYYKGTEEQWDDITIDDTNESLLNATIHFLSEDDAECGQCGDNVFWSYDNATYKLTISGTGSMWDYENGKSPFLDMEIKEVVIKEEVSSIGSYAFAGCESLHIVRFGKNIKSIGISAFDGCDLASNSESNFKEERGIYYFGTSAEFKKISISQPNEILDKAKKICTYSCKAYENEETNSTKNVFDGEAIALTDYIVPGIYDDMIPQGLAYYKEKNWFLISAYHKTEGSANPGVIYALDKDTGEFVAQFNLYNVGGTVCKAHLGGIAVSDNNVYVTYYENKIAYLPLREIDVDEYTVKDIRLSGSIEIKPLAEAEDKNDDNAARTAYIEVCDGVLWTGNFYNGNVLSSVGWLSKSYGYKATKKNNTIIVGYSLSGSNSEDEWNSIGNKEKYRIKLANDVKSIQGATIDKDELNREKLYISVTTGASFGAEVWVANLSFNNKNVAELKKKNFTYKGKNIDGAEEIIIVDDYLYSIYESAALSNHGDFIWGDWLKSTSGAMTKVNINNLKPKTKNVFNCPIDIEVIDSETGEIVCKIVNNVIDEEIASKENALYAEVVGETKYIYTPNDKNYEFKITGNGTGKMDYTVVKVDEDGYETERVNFFDVEITEETVLFGNLELSEDQFELSDYILEGTASVNATEYMSSASEELNINISAGVGGYAIDSFECISGDVVEISASCDEGYAFVGWYENDELVSSESDYVFVAKNNRNLEARFELVDHDFGDWYTTVVATCENRGVQQRDCSECDYYETQEIPATGHTFDGSKCKNCDYNKADDCSCKCHKGGISGFFFKIILFFQKIFRTNKTCSCGVNHY